MADNPATRDEPASHPAEYDGGPGVPLDTVLTTASDLGQFNRPWWFAGGWAIDLFLGRVTRPHADLEVGIWRDDQSALRSLWPGHAWDCAAEGAWVPWYGEPVELPLFQLRVSDPAGPREVEFFLNDRATDGAFVCRRDHRVRLPAERLVVRSPLGPPVLAPEVQLLYKAKHARPKDEHDLTVALLAMSADQRAWLAAAVAVLHPGHAWLDRLGRD